MLPWLSEQSAYYNAGRVGLRLAYIHCGQKGGFEAVIAQWLFLESQQTVDE